MHPQSRSNNPAPVSPGETETVPQAAPPFPQLLKDRYRIEGPIGAGGFAAVYLARDTELHDRLVVIKILHKRQDLREWIEKKFRHECEALSRIEHPGVVGVKDQGSLPDGRPFLVLEFINGATLRAVMMRDQRGLGLLRVAGLIRQISQALSAAHDAGVHHRDLKPENIMIRELGDGQEMAVIIDFGIATVLNPEVEASAATMVAGSRHYMAPEQLSGKPEAASDLYALGVIAFEMVTGSRPFRAGPAVDLYQQQKDGPKEDPCALRPGLSPLAGAAILKALSFDAAKRYARAVEFGIEFERAITGHPLHAAAGVEPDGRQSQLHTRMLDVGMQAQVPIYEPAELVALIRRTESAGLKAIIETDPDFSITEHDIRSRPFQMEFPRDHAGRAQPLELSLRIASPDFEPKEQSKIILVPPDRDSEAYTFLLTPQHLGELRLTLEVRLGAVHIASKIIKTHAERSERIMAAAGRSLVSIPIQVLVDLAGALPPSSHGERPEPVTQASQLSSQATGAFRLLSTLPEQPVSSEVRAFKNLLQHGEEARERAPKDPASRSQKRISGFFRNLKPGWRLAGVPVALSLVLVSGVFFYRANHHEEDAVARGGVAAKQSLPHQQEAPASPAPMNPTPQRPLAAAGPPAMANLLLVPNDRGRGNEKNVLRVRNQPTVQLLIDLGDDPHTAYRVVLASAAVPFSRDFDNVHPRRDDGGSRQLALKFPSSLLHTGDYTVTIFGLTLVGTAEPVARSSFSVLRGDSRAATPPSPPPSQPGLDPGVSSQRVARRRGFLFFKETKIEKLLKHAEDLWQQRIGLDQAAERGKLKEAETYVDQVLEVESYNKKALTLKAKIRLRLEYLEAFPR